MEIVNVVGKRTVRFKDKQSGQEVAGERWYFTQDIQDERVEGLICSDCFLSDRVLAHLSYRPAVGSSAEVVYNRFGKVADFIQL